MHATGCCCPLGGRRRYSSSPGPPAKPTGDGRSTAATRSMAPDGGCRAWSVVVASFLIFFVADGVAYTFGVLLPTIAEHFDAGRSSVGGVASLMIGVSWSSGPLASIVNNRCGFRTTTIIGSALAAFGFAISSVAPNVQFLYFSLGIVAGLGLGLVYLPPVVAINFYFDRRRSLATGLAVCGSGVGTVVFASLVAGRLLDNYGWSGTLLIESAILLNCCACGLIFHAPAAADHRGREPATTDDDDDIKQPYGNGLQPHRRLSDMSVDYAVVSVLLAQEDEKSRNQKEKEAVGRITGVDAILSYKLTSNGSLPGCVPSGTPDIDAVQPCTRNQRPFPCPRDHDAPGALQHLATPGDNNNTTTTARTSQKSPARRGRHARTSEKPARRRGRYFDVRLLADPIFVVFAVSNAMTFAGYSVPYVYLPDLGVVQAALDADAAAVPVSVIGVTITVTKVAFGAVADLPCVSRVVVSGVALTVSGLASAFVVHYESFAMLVAYAAVFGTCMGVYTCTMPVVLVDLFGVDLLSNSYGAILFCCGVGTAVGTPVAGWLFDVSRNYGNSFLFAGVTIGLSGLLVILLSWLRRRRRHQQPEGNEPRPPSPQQVDHPGRDPDSA